MANLVRYNDNVPKIMILIFKNFDLEYVVISSKSSVALRSTD